MPSIGLTRGSVKLDSRLVQPKGMILQSGEKGVLAVTDWDTQTGENLSFILNKNTGTAYPMIQLKPGGLIYIPLPKTIDISNAFVSDMMNLMMHSQGVDDKPILQQGVAHAREDFMQMQNNNDEHFHGSALANSIQIINDKDFNGVELASPMTTSAVHPIETPLNYKFSVGDLLYDDEPCTCAHLATILDDALLNAHVALAATSEAAFISDILPSLSKRDQNFLMHCRLSHLSMENIKKLKDEGTPGVVYHPNLKELCAACLEAR